MSRSARSSGSVVVLLELVPLQGREIELFSLLVTQLPDTRAFAGCLGLTLLRDIESTAAMVDERWESIEAHRRYVRWRSSRGELQQLLDLLAQPPTFRRFELVERYDRPGLGSANVVGQHESESA